MNPTAIEWVLNQDSTRGFTSNPFTGCLGPKSDGIRCPYCYAWRESLGRCKQADLRGTPIALPWDDDPFFPRFHPERLDQIRSRQKPTGIFLCDRSDFAAAYWPREWQAQLWDMILDCPQHRFYLLTHQPQELQKWSPFPGNCRVGVTATNTVETMIAMKYLVAVKASVKFLSIEPLLRRILPHYGGIDLYWDTLSWVIIGSMTTRRSEALHHPTPYPELTLMPYGKIWTLQPDRQWIAEIIHAADKAQVPVFLKNNLKPLFPETFRDREWAPPPFFTPDWDYRQEMPK